MDAASAIVFLNGRYIPRAQATLDVEDRAALFGDGVYEVLRFYRGRPLAMREHLERLRASMAAIGLTENEHTPRLDRVSHELVDRNRLSDARLYWQVSRGPGPREHAFPKNPRHTVMALISPADPIDPDAPAKALTAVTAEDERWHRCNIKSLMLLPNVLARNKASAAGAYEALLHRGQTVTEGTCTSLFIARGGELWTHPADQWILPGITRALVLQTARRDGITIRERTFTVSELRGADEVFICGSTTHVAGIVKIDGAPVADGEVGPLTRRVNRLFLHHIAAECYEKHAV